MFSVARFTVKRRGDRTFIPVTAIKTRFPRDYGYIITVSARLSNRFDPFVADFIFAHKNPASVKRAGRRSIDVNCVFAAGSEIVVLVLILVLVFFVFLFVVFVEVVGVDVVIEVVEVLRTRIFVFVLFLVLVIFLVGGLGAFAFL